MKQIPRAVQRGRAQSPPMRGRGLKHRLALVVFKSDKSPPMRGRGLKLASACQKASPLRSPPMRGRGLKQAVQVDDLVEYKVAPHAGAWIET